MGRTPSDFLLTFCGRLTLELSVFDVSEVAGTI